MTKRIFHIAFIALLALNLSGAGSFAYSPDCGMECCEPADWEGTVSFEAPTCCDMDDVTCGFEAVPLEDLFEEAICCHNGGNLKTFGQDSLSLAVSYYALTHAPTHPLTLASIGSPATAPIFLSNAAILC